MYWKEWERDFFISQLQALYPQNPDAIDKIFLQAIKDWRLLYDCTDETVVEKSFDSLLEIHNRYTIKEEGDEVKAVKQAPHTRQDQLDHLVLESAI